MSLKGSMQSHYLFVKMKLSLCSFNVRGLGQKIKREQIFTHLHTKQFNVCFLQETHSTKDVETAWAANSPYNLYFSGRSSSSSGISIMIDHSIVTFSMHFTNEQRGPGYFKINNSLLLQSEYQKQIKNTISETATNNVDATPNVLWEVIKGSIRNTTIQYASKMKKENREHEIKLIEDINNLQRDIPTSNTMEDDVKKLQDKKSELQELQEKRSMGL